MYLFFDTETTGLPANWNAPVSNSRNWPRMVQLACLLCDEEGTILEERNYIIKPEGYTIPSQVVRIHGISTERANREGVDLAMVLTDFQSLCEKATYLVAHNMEFDEKILGAEYHRKIGKNPLISKPKLCTMKQPSIIQYCAISPIRYGSYKWPSLSELHYKVFGTSFSDQHNAAADIKATAACFFELKQRQII